MHSRQRHQHLRRFQAFAIEPTSVCGRVVDGEAVPDFSGHFGRAQIFGTRLDTNKRDYAGEKQQPATAADTPVEALLTGHALELWSDSVGERFWLVADEQNVDLTRQRSWPRRGMHFRFSKSGRGS